MAGFTPDERSADAPDAPRARAQDLRMEMPVELWFGEHHIGVKANSATCETFQRYADELLRELRAAKASLR